MFSLTYAWNELRRRAGRTLVTAFGLAAGVGLVMGIIGVSEGLSNAQNKVLSPLGSVGTDIIVTRTVAATTSTATTTTTTSPRFSGGGGGGGGFGGGGGGFFARGVGGANQSDQASLLNANSSILTDLAKLGPAGTKFTHDFLVPGTLITFSQAAVSDVAKLPGVSAAVGGLSLQALHETGTVPKIVSTVKTGGQTISTTVKRPVLTSAQTLTERTCIQKILEKQFAGNSVGAITTPGAGSRGGTAGGGSGISGARRFGGFASNPAIQKCLTPAQVAYQQKVVVPERTITSVLNPPTTNTQTSTYTVAGVDPSNSSSGLITKSQVVSGTWFTGLASGSPSTNTSAANSEVLVNTAWATQKKLKVGGTVTINSNKFTIVGLVAPTLTGNISDYYFTLPTLQKLASSPGYVNEVLVGVHSASQVKAVTAEIKRILPGATILTAQTLADQVTGSLNNAHKLANDLGGALAIVVLLAAFLVAGLLTLSSVAKRVREIGSLRAIGWSRRRVVSQIMTETLGIGVLGGALGIGVGVVVCVIIGAIGPSLSVTSSGLAVGASTVGNIVGQATTGSISTVVKLSAPIHVLTILIAFAGALVGGLLAGAAGGWRAARLAPASALRDLG